MNVPMYQREEEREFDRLLAEKEARWEQAGLMQKQQSKLQKILQEQNDEKAWIEAMRNQGMGVRAGGVAGILGGPYQSPFNMPKQNPTPPPDPNTMPEMQMSLEDAYNMWLVRFGDMWVKGEEVEDADGFRWAQIASRLKATLLMEHLTNTGHYRLVPKVWK